MYRILLTCCFLFMVIKCFAQPNHFSLGKIHLKYDKIFYKSTITSYEYTILKSPKKLRRLDADTFHPSHLETPYSVAQSFVLANTNDWLNQLTEDNSKQKINADGLVYSKSKEFKQKYHLEVQTEFNFIHGGKQYVILLIFFHGKNGQDINLPLLLVKGNEGWKISSNHELISFSQFHYLNPEIIFNILSFLPVQIDGLDEYITGGIFNIDKNFFYQYYSSSIVENKNFLQATIPFNSPVDLKVNETVVVKNKRPIAIAKRKFQYMNLMAYDKEDYLTWYFSYQQKLSNNGPKYDSLPEIALASWIFSKDINEKKANSIGFDNIKNSAERYIQAGGVTNRIEWLYKIEFYSNGIEYALIYFSEWYGQPVNGATREQWIGDKSVLLKKDNKNWILVFDVYDDMLNLQYTFDLLSFEGIKLVLSGIKTGNEEVDKFIEGEFLAYPPDSRIYINSIHIIHPKFLKFNSLPKELSRGWGILGAQDIKGDEILPYWMNRK